MHTKPDKQPRSRLGDISLNVFSEIENQRLGFLTQKEAGSTSSGLLKLVVRPRIKIDFLTFARNQIYLSHNWENKNSGE
jgi:hypothetical protein